MKPKVTWIALCTVAISFCIWLLWSNRRPDHPLKVSFWHWQTPYELTVAELEHLKQMNVKQIFVRAGTFSSDGENIVLTIPQKYGSGSNSLPVHLVFNADAGVLRHFEDYKLETIVPQISSRLLGQMDAAKRAGVDVIGIQLDLDIPTRLLAKYAQLVRGIRQSNPTFGKRKGFYFSASGLMSWLGTSGAATLSSELDFIVPQAYEGVTGTTVDKMRPVFDPEDLKQRLSKAERLNCPYWVGIPAYGHAFLFDNQGRLTSTYRGLEAQDALRHPSFALEAAYPSDRLGGVAANEDDWVGEEIVKFKAVRPDQNGRGLGYTLAYSLPTPELVGKASTIVDQFRGQRCQGVIIYRMPEPGSSFTVDLDSTSKALQGKSVSPKFEVKVSKGKDVLGAIEENQNRIPIDLYVTAKNIGDAPTAVAPDAFELTLELNKPGIGEARLRNFDSMDSFQQSNGQKLSKSSPANANVLVLRKGFVATGTTLVAGPIRLRSTGDLYVKIKMRIRTKSGLVTTDTQLPDTLLKAESGTSP